MSASHCKPSFGEGVIVALMLSVLGSIAYFIGYVILGAIIGFTPIIAMVAGAYALYLVKRSTVRSGKLFAASAVVAITGVFILVPVSLFVLISAIIFGIWLIRACMFRSGVLDSVGDFLLIGTSVAAGTLAMLHTQSLFISLWTFFVIQALHIYLPVSVHGKEKETVHERKFEHAFKKAERALRHHYSGAN